MKQIILLTISLFIYSASFSQTQKSSSSSWNKSVFDNTKNVPELKIYPNPCKKEKITIDFKTHKISEIYLVSITGKQVLKKKFNFPENKKELKLNDIPNGIYLLKAKSVDNKVVVKKLIISKQ